jgi:hypothetical protein
VAVDSKGNLFASLNGGILYEISTTDASLSLIGNTGEGVNLYAGTFVGSTLYGFASNSTSTATQVVTIDTSSANVTPGPNINLPPDYVVVAAAAPPVLVPEPTSLVLGLIGGLGVLACYRLRRSVETPCRLE